MAMNSSPQVAAELTIGIVGSHDLVEKIMLSGPLAAPGQAGSPPVAGRFIAAAYRDEQEAADRVVRLGSSIDVCLFASKVPYGYARKAGVLTGPATYVTLSGSALYSALLRACLADQQSLARCSVDVLSRGEVEEAFAEIGAPAGQVHVHDEPATPAALASFHERLWRDGRSSMAFTCMQSVAARLAAARVPVLTVAPTGPAIRSALLSAALLGANHRLETAQLLVMVVEVPDLRDGPGRRGVPRLSREELRLTVQRLLVQEAQRIQAVVTPASDHGFLVIATGGSLAAVTDGFRRRPFVDRARAELGLGIEVGMGTGPTVQNAEAQARAQIMSFHTARGGRRATSGGPVSPDGPAGLQRWAGGSDTGGSPTSGTVHSGGPADSGGTLHSGGTVQSGGTGMTHPAGPGDMGGPGSARPDGPDNAVSTSDPASRSNATAHPGPGGQASAVPADRLGDRAAGLVPAPRYPAGSGPRPRALETLSRLAESLASGDDALAVDAETASRVLAVTPRTARRLLRALAEEGLAWPLPPSRAPQPGRPRQSYRLVVERLHRPSS
jgi:hypothetical protein